MRSAFLRTDWATVERERSEVLSQRRLFNRQTGVEFAWRSRQELLLNEMPRPG
jgi:hypothetical protein